MTTFATAFSSSDQGDKTYSDTFVMNPTNDFSNIDLDQQVASFENYSSSYLSFNKPTKLENNISSSTTTAAIPNNPSDSSSSLSSERVSRHSLSSMDRRVTMPDISKLSITSAAAVAAVGPKFDKFKQWSRTAYKCTKQTIFEKLGKTTRTVDVELDGQIEQFRETKRRYENMLALARSYANHFYNLMQTQKSLSEQFLELKQRSSFLTDEFSYNAHTQNLLVENGQTLSLALNYFISSLTTLCTKTMEDTLSTIRSYETARLEYDACRTEVELLSNHSHSMEKQNDLEKYKDKYQQLKCSVQVKLQLLDENQSKVMKNQLLLFHNAISAYFSGNKQALDNTMKQFNLKVIPNNENNHEKQSFLEQSHR